MDNNILTIIIPVYNVEKYLEECLESIVSQSLQCFDVILIDDGSTDSSGSICDRYEANNNNFKVIHKQNGGVSSARNEGIKVSKTKYITFIDSDDFISKDFISNLVQPILDYDDIDFVQAGFQSCDPLTSTNGTIQHYDYYCGIDPIKVFNEFRGMSFSKIFVLDVVLKNHIFFDTNVSLAEDYIFTLQYLYYVKHYCFIPEIGYFYRRAEGSLSTKTVVDYGKDKYFVTTKFDAIMKYMSLHNIRVEQSKKCIPQVAGDLSWQIYLLYHTRISSTYHELSFICNHYRLLFRYLPFQQRICANIAAINCKIGDLLFFVSYKIDNKIRRLLN